ncbi:hypothetical protein [Paeniglutamicibacter sp. NPDC091659]|uniref:hypothetical protein n=1 Tax=Paeniglutamicibacter sp. NPDC091659 TaxID=3364389 RepID=UPI00382F3B35
MKTPAWTAGGNFRLSDRLLTEIERPQVAKDLNVPTSEIVDDERLARLIGHQTPRKSGHLPLRFTAFGAGKQ